MTDCKVTSTLRMLKAAHGDAFILTVTNGSKTTNVLIDSGPKCAYLKEVLPALEGIDFFDLCIITHFDEDHSNGLVAYLTENPSRIAKFGKYWINSPSLIRVNLNPEISSYSMCNDLRNLLSDYEKQNNCIVDCHDEIIVGTTYVDPNGLVRITVLSPTAESKKKFEDNYKKEYVEAEIAACNKQGTLAVTLEEWAGKQLNKDDHKKQIINDCSISCLIETDDKCYLMLGDIREEIIIPWIKKYNEDHKHKLKVDFVKVPHHGSMKNISENVLNLIDCNNFIISTNGRYGLPDRYTIAKILMNHKPDEREKINLYFNYDRKEMEENYGAWFLTDEEVTSENNNFETLIAGSCQ